MFYFKYSGFDYSHKLDYASNPQDEYYSHFHTFYEIIYFIKGNVTYSVEGIEKRLDSGDIIVIQPGQYHFGVVDKSLKYERFVIKFPIEFVPLYIRNILKGKGSYYEKSSSLGFIFSQFENTISNEEYSNDDKVTLLSAETLKLLVLLSKKDNVSSSKKDEIVDLLIEYINNHLEERLTLTSISNVLNYSESYLSTIFRKKMKCSLMLYIRYKKCFLAYLMIQSGEKPHDVSEKLGYSEYSTFYRLYKSTLGFSPSEKKEVNIENNKFLNANLQFN